MIANTTFYYRPNESELERASNSYLMSLVAVIGGLPLPILNLLASIFFYLGNRNSTPFVKWHCTQNSKKTVIHHHDKTRTKVVGCTSVRVNLGKGCSSYC